MADSLLQNIEANVESIWPLEAAAQRALAHSVAGRREEALEELDEAERLLTDWPDDLTGGGFAFGLAATYGRLGELDRGFALLEDAVDGPNLVLGASTLRLNPGLDAYHDDPRFDELVGHREAYEADRRAWAEAHRPWLP